MGSDGSFGRKRPSALNLSAMALVSCAAFGPVEGKFAYSQDCGFRSHTYLLNCVSDGIYLSAVAVFTIGAQSCRLVNGPVVLKGFSRQVLVFPWLAGVVHFSCRQFSRYFNQDT